MTVEVNNDSAVIWTKPDDYVPDPNDPAKGLRGVWRSGFHAGFADGSVHFFSRDADADLWMRLFQRNDGQTVNYDEIRR
jgi:hypothetical protein